MAAPDILEKPHLAFDVARCLHMHSAKEVGEFVDTRLHYKRAYLSDREAPKTTRIGDREISVSLFHRNIRGCSNSRSNSQSREPESCCLRAAAGNGPKRCGLGDVRIH